MLHADTTSTTREHHVITRKHRGGANGVSGGVNLLCAVWILVAALSLLAPGRVLVAGVDTCTPCPARGCQCSRLPSGGCKVECRGLSDVPRPANMPPGLTHLKLSYCNLPSLAVRSFVNLTDLTDLAVTQSEVAEIEEGVFNSLTNLQSLDLQGNKISILPARTLTKVTSLKTLILKRNAFTSLPPQFLDRLNNLETIDLQNTGITSFDKFTFKNNRKLINIIIDENPLVNCVPAELFQGLSKLSNLRLSYSKCQSLQEGIFDGLTSLQTITLGGNPWRCDCMLGWLRTWLYDQKKNNGLVISDQDSIKCTTPNHLVGSNLMALKNKDYACETEDYVSCFLDEGSNNTLVIGFKSRRTAHTKAGCNALCHRKSYKYAVLFGHSCFCGTSNIIKSCKCPHLSSPSLEPLHSSEFCRRTYLRNVFPVFPNIRLTNVKVYTTNAPAEFFVACDLEVKEYSWRFGDALQMFRTTKGTISHSYTLPGDYTLTISILTESLDTEMVRFPIRVVDPLVRQSLSVVQGDSVTQPVDAKLRLYDGSSNVVMWSRTDSTGRTVTGTECASGWTALSDKCVKLLSSEQASLAAAQRACREATRGASDAGDARLITLTAASQITELSQQLSLRKTSYWTDAVYNTSTRSYTWSSTGHATYFSSLTTGDGRCVVLEGAESQLSADSCQSSHQPICQTDLIGCKHGGQRHNDHCYLTSTTGLSWKNAESQCQSFQGRLAVADTEDIHRFITDSLILSNKNRSPEYWIGLSDQLLDNTFMWTSGVSLGTTYTRWMTRHPTPNPGPRDCVAMTLRAGDYWWKDMHCDLKKHFICQYAVGTVVPDVQIYRAGISMFTRTAHVAVNLDPRTDAAPNAETRLIILPGMWFQHAGYLRSFSYVSPSGIYGTIHLQVYRPLCPTGQYLLPPGCSGNASPYAVCVPTSTAKTKCPNYSPGECSPNSQYCPLAQKCISVRAPCNCNLYASACSDSTTRRRRRRRSSRNTDAHMFSRSDFQDEELTSYNDSASDFAQFSAKYFETKDEYANEEEVVPRLMQLEADEQFISSSSSSATDDDTVRSRQKRAGHRYTNSPPNYELISSTPLDVSTKAETRIYVSMGAKLDKVKVGDVIGFQYNLKRNMVNCDSNAKSQHRESGLLCQINEWMQVGGLTSESGCNFGWNDDLVCNIQAKYSKPVMTTANPEIVSAGSLLQGTYMYKVQIKNPATVSPVNMKKQIFVEKPIKSIALLGPEINVKSANTDESLGTIGIEVGQKIIFLVIVRGGIPTEVLWSIGDKKKSPMKTCPNQYSKLAECLSPGETDQFSKETFQFSTVEQKTLNVSAVGKINTKFLTVDIEIQETVKGLKVTGDRLTVNSGDEVTFTASSNKGTSVSYLWSTSDGTKKRTSVNEFTHKFPTTGLHNVTVVASNLIGSMTAVTSVTVEEKQHPHNIRIVAPSTAASGEEITFKITFATINHKNFVLACEFGDGEKSSKSLSSTSKQTELSVEVRHIYKTAATYTVNVIITDNVDVANMTHDIVIKKKITGLTLSAKPKYAAMNSKVFFSVKTVGDSEDLMYVWDFGDGTETVTTKDQNMTRTYSDPDSYKVTVTTSNGISQASDSITIYIDKVIKGLFLKYDGPTKLGSPTIFTTGVSLGTSITYELDPGDGSDPIKQDNSTFTHKYKNEGSYTAAIKAYNLISTRTKDILVYVMDVKTLNIISLTGKSCIMTGEVATYKVDVINFNVTYLLYRWTSCDGQVMTGIGLQAADISVKDAVNSCSVQVEVSDGENTVKKSKEICVQAPVTDPTLTTNSPVTFVKGQTAQIHLEVSAISGSNLRYVWSLGNKTWTTPSHTETVSFTEPGEYAVTVKVRNKVSSQMVTKTLFVQERIRDLQLNIPTSVIYICKGVAHLFVASISSGSQVEFKWKLQDTASVVDGDRNMTFTYQQVGEYRLTVQAVNQVSMEVDSRNINVQDPVTGLSLTSSDREIEPNQSVKFVASKKSGTSIRYRWKLCANCTETDTTSSDMTHTFKDIGEYTVFVTCYNNVTKQEVYIVIYVTSVIKGLSVTSELIDGENAAKGRSYKFRAMIIEGARVHYSWVATRALTGVDVFRGSGSEVAIVFENLGRHSIFLTASNSISQATAKVEVEVFEEISQLVLIMSSDYLKTNQAAPIRASYVTGSAVSMRWRIQKPNRSFVDVSSTHTKIDFEGETAGSYTIFCNASNAISSEMAQKSFMVLDQIEEPEIIVENGDVKPVNQKITFTASIKKGTEPTYKWQVVPTEKKDSYTESVLHYVFTKIGIYHISLHVENKVSQGDKVISVVIQEPIRNLAIGMTSAEVIYDTDVKFVAEKSSGSDSEFEWDFGDGSKIRTRDVTTYHKFNKKAGVLLVSLTARNGLGAESANMTVWVVQTITGVSIVECCETYVAAGSSKMFTPQVKTGSLITYDWLVVHEKNKYEVTSEKLTFDFKSVGRYTITVTASNKISDETSPPSTVIAQASISSVDIITDINLQFAYANQDITFMANAVGGTNIEYDWFDTDTKKHEITSNNAIVRNFRNHGVYSVNVKAYNKISTAEKSVRFEIKEVICEKPKLTVIGGENHEVLKSRAVIIEVAVDLHDCTVYEVSHHWRIIATPHCSITGEEVVLPEAVSLNSNMLVLPPLMLSYGTYCVHFTSEYKGTPVNTAVTINLKVLKSNLNAIIKGGSVRAVGVKNEVTLDGRSSYDPDDAESSGQRKAQLTYVWHCTSVTAKNVRFDLPTQGCFSSLQGPVVSIPRNTLVAGRRYSFTLTVMADGRNNASSVQEVIVMADETLEVFVECLSCSATNSFSISRSQHIKLVSKCTNCVKNHHTRYSYLWTVTYADGSKVVFKPGESTTGFSQRNLVIKRGVLNNHMTYIFTLSVRSNDLNQSSFASLTLTANPTPSNGICVAKPSSVVAIEQPVHVNCTGWKSAETISDPLMYVIQIEHWNEQIGDIEVYTLYHGPQNEVDVYLSSWPNQRHSDYVNLVVFVRDHKMASTLALNQTITFIPPTLQPGQSKSQYLSQKAQTLVRLLRQRKLSTVLQYAAALIMQLNDESAKSPGAEVDLRSSTRTLTASVLNSSLQIQSIIDVKKAALIFKLLTAFPREMQSGGSQMAILDKTEANVELLQLSAAQGLSSEDFCTPQLLATVTNIINAANLKIYANQTNNNGDDDDDIFAGEVQAGELEDRLVKVKRAKDLADRIMTAVLKTKVVGEEPIIIKSNGVSSEGSRVTVNGMRKSLKLEGCEFHLPGNLLDIVGRIEVYQILFVHFSNPYTWGYQNQITSQVAGLSFKYTNGSAISVANLEPNRAIHIVMSRTSPKDGVKKRRKRRSVSSPVSDGSNYVVNNEVSHTNFSMNITEKKLLAVNRTNSASGAALHIRILVAKNESEMLQNSSLDESASGIDLRVYLGKGRVPTEEDYDDMIIITNRTYTEEVPILNYTLFVKESEVSKHAEFLVLVVNRSPAEGVSVTVGTYYSRCLYYSEHRDTWDSTGCSVDPHSQPDKTMCYCDHLASFGATVIFPINDIDFRDLLDLDFSENPVAIVTCSVILGIYLVFMIIAIHWDRQDLRNISIVPLCGKDGSFKYEITVVTGRQRGAGTTANVGVNLYGELGKSGPCHLYKPGAFKRNSTDVLLIATELSLGELWKLRLWHDNTGRNPTWYVSRVMVRDLQTNKKYYFLVESWLTLKYEKCSIDKDVFVAGDEELRKFGWLFRTEASHGFAENHVWMSVWDRPARSRFTRAQRVTCCVTLLYTYMAVNAMWYGAIKTTTPADALINFDNVFSWEEILVGMVSSLIVFPINLAIVTLFRKSKNKLSGLEWLQKPGTAQTIEIDCEISRAGSSLGSYCEGTDFIVPYERESTTDSISVHAGKLKRTGNLKLLRGESSDEIQKDISENTAPSSGGSADNKKKVDSSNPLWWSYDSILKWPEQLPSWTDGLDSRQTSASSTRNAISTNSNQRPMAAKKHRTPVRRSSKELATVSGKVASDIVGIDPRKEKEKNVTKRTRVRRFSITDSIDEILEDEAFWSSSQSESSWSSYDKTKDSKSTNQEQPPNHPLNNNNNEVSTTPHPKKDQSEQAVSETINQSQVKADSENKQTDIKPTNGLFSRLSLANLRNPFSIMIEKARGLMKKSEHTNKVSNMSRRRSDLTVVSFSDDTKGGLGDGIPLQTMKTYPQMTSVQDFNPREEAQLATTKLVSGVSHSDAGMSSLKDLTTLEDTASVALTNNWPTHLNRRCSSASFWRRSMPVMSSPAPQRQRCLLPHWCIYLAYTLCLLLSIFCIVLVILYGHKFGTAKALKWLVALLISFVQSFFITEPLKVIFFAFFLAAITKKMESDEDVSLELPPVVEYNEKIKPMKMRPIGGYALLQAREEGRKVRRMHFLLRHSLVYVCLFWLVLIVNFATHDNMQYVMTARVRDVFVRRSLSTDDHNCTRRSYERFWSWLETVVAPGVHKHELEPLTTLGLPLGVARLRQIRSHTVSCPAESVLARFGASWLTARGCYGDPGHVEDTAAYQSGWSSEGHANLTWIHQNAHLTQSAGVQGKLSWYNGGGYVQNLATSYAETLTTIQALRDNNWVDRGTRAVFVEWTLYNTNLNHYSVMSLLVEFPLSGGLVFSHSIQTVHRFELRLDYAVDMLFVCKMLMAVICCYLVISCVLSLQDCGWRHLLSFWSVLELAVTALTLTALVVYVHNLVHDADVFQRHLQHSALYTSFTSAAYWYSVWKRLMAALVFLLMLLAVKQLRFIKPLSVYGRTLRHASPRLCGCLLIFILIILMYSQLGHLIYGSIVMEFRSVGWSLLTLVGVIRGHSSLTFDETFLLTQPFTVLFFGSFVAVVFVAVMGLIIAVMNDAYKMIKCQMYYHNTLDVQDYEMIEFMMKRFKLWAGISKPKPAFRKVKFQGLASVSSRTYSSQSSRTAASLASSDQILVDSLEDNTSQYMEQLLEQVVPRWEDMLSKLDQVVALEEEQQNIDNKIAKFAKEVVLNKYDSKQKKSSLPLRFLQGTSTGDRRVSDPWALRTYQKSSFNTVARDRRTSLQSEFAFIYQEAFPETAPASRSSTRSGSDLDHSVSKWAVSSVKKTDREREESAAASSAPRGCSNIVRLNAQMRRNSDVAKILGSVTPVDSRPPFASQSRVSRVTASRRNSITSVSPLEDLETPPPNAVIRPFSDQAFKAPSVPDNKYLPKPAKPAW